jgi:hypothetical protein
LKKERCHRDEKGSHVFTAPKLKATAVIQVTIETMTGRQSGFDPQ